MRFWANLIGYQLVWFAAVIGAGRGSPWWGVAAALVFAVAQWLDSNQRSSDARLVACALVLGIGLDGALAATGVLDYAAATPGLFAPLWILAMWVAFAMTLNHSLALLRGHVSWAIVLGAVGGPLAYIAAARGFAAVEFIAPRWQALGLLAAGWGLAMGLLAWLAQRWRHQEHEQIHKESVQ